MITQTWDGATVKYYLDADYRAQWSAGSPNFDSVSAEAFLGAQGTFNYFYGFLGQVRLYNKTLSPSEVAGVYNEGRYATP